ncbi:hypothetical protein GWI33_006755 [Rhynchophorus ferrugineus]|uniref:C2H2-type domain-containing protein n=1 Tax=Rhynchophorus ferrugineus TaxID=354439 RepID=A0A834IIM3_RHYFE|nr:hypothetical protein GWI33_006755 [Rhynchophorus ferrugineus]
MIIKKCLTNKSEFQDLISKYNRTKHDLKIDAWRPDGRDFGHVLHFRDISQNKMLLSCPLCSKPHFEGVNALRTTLVSVATSPLMCPVCKETLMGLDKLTIHLFRHVNDNTFGASVQSLNYDGADSNQVQYLSDEVNETEEKRNIINDACEDIAVVPCEGMVNKNDGCPSPSRPTSPALGAIGEETVACDICSFTFSDRNILDMHQKLLHQTIPDQKTGQYSYHCHLCSKKFRMRGQVRSPEYKQWSCDVCAKMFTTKYFLKKHKRLHTGEMPYSCNICNKSFTFQQSYHKHMLYHSSDKPYVCTECGRAFKEHSTLQNHIRIHSGERPFGCEICGKKFRQRVSYLVHMRIHTGVMPYKCTACNKSFRYKVSQKSHKCPMNPPGTVIRVSDGDTAVPATSNDRTAQDVKGNNEQIAAGTTTNDLTLDNSKTPKCIMSVDYNTGNINLIPKPSQNQQIMPQIVYGGNNIGQTNGSNTIGSSEIEQDVYTMVLPILPQVESLCLTSENSPVNDPISPIEVIREKCLEELFQ